MPTRSIISMARVRAARRPRPPCAWITCAIESLTRRTGLRAVRGSWNTIAMLDPRSACISPSSSPRRSRAPYALRPLMDRPRGMSLRIARQVRLLPEPLSPTRPNASPGAIVNDTFRTTLRPSRANVTDRRSTSSASLRAMDPAHDVRRAVADQADEESGHDDGEAREDHDPRGGDDEVAALGDHHAPLGRRGLHAETEEAQRGSRQDVEHEVAHPEDEGRHHHVREQVPEHDPEVAVPEAPGGEDVAAPPRAKRLAAHNSRVGDPAHQRDRDVEVREPRAQHRDDREDE